MQDRSDGGGRRTEQARSKDRVKTKTAHGGSESPSARLAAAQKAIGNFLRATRASQRLTQQQVATLTRKSPWQLSRAAISAIERGQNFPGMEAMLALSHVLYIDPKELVERARMSTVVPVDVTGMTYEDLEHRAEHYFWAGDFRQALSVYDAILEKIALEGGSRTRPPRDGSRGLRSAGPPRSSARERSCPAIDGQARDRAAPCTR